MVPTLLAVALTAAPVSASRLGVVVQGDDATSQALLAACPRIAVFPMPSPGGASVPAQVAAYKQGCAGATAILQVGGQGLAVDGSTAAVLWPSAWLPLVQTVNSAHVDGVEGPSEPTGSAANLSAFWASFAQLVSGSTYLPVVGALPSGLPAAAGTPDDAFCATATAVQAMRVTWAWSYHARSPTMTTSTATEGPTTLGYRTILSDCPELSGPGAPLLFLTQAGPSSRAWQTTDSSWIAFLDGEVAKDARVVGAALFEAGAAGTFTLSPMASFLASYLANPSPDGGTDGGGDGGADGGGGGTAGPGGGGAPGGAPGAGPTESCSCATPGLAGMALVPVLLRRRRRPTA